MMWRGRFWRILSISVGSRSSPLEYSGARYQSSAVVGKPCDCSHAKLRSRVASDIPDGVLLGVARADLVVNARVRLFQSVAQLRARLPAEYFFDQRVVAVAAVHSLWSLEVVLPLELLTGDVFHDVHELVARD